MIGQATSRRRLSDAELAETDFRFIDPENTIIGLNASVPDPEANPVIIGYYDETPAGGRNAVPKRPFVRCSHCGMRRHWNGRVVRDDRGELHIIGARQCGREHYGVRFDAAETAFKAEQDRRSALLRWKVMIERVPTLLAEVTAVLQSPALTIVDLLREQLRRASPTGFQKLAKMAESGEPLIERRELRDFAAEKTREARFKAEDARYRALSVEERRQVRDDGLKPELDETPIVRRIAEPLGPLAGADFLTSRADVRKPAVNLRALLETMQVIQRQGTDGATTTEISKHLRAVSELPREIQSALSFLSSLHLFFTDDNLNRLERWSRTEARFGYSRQEGDLVVEDPTSGRTLISNPGKLDLPPINASEEVGEVDGHASAAFVAEQEAMRRCSA